LTSGRGRDSKTTLRLIEATRLYSVLAPRILTVRPTTRTRWSD
jgi:hypothetical protein